MESTTIDSTQAELELAVHGFVVLEEVIEPDQVAAMQATLSRLNTEEGVEHNFRGSAGYVANLPPRDPVFFPLIGHPAILPMLEKILGDGLIMSGMSGRIVRPGDPAQELHSDVLSHMLNPVSPVMMTVLWLLDDFSPVNGGTLISPGSHLTGMYDPPDGFTPRYVVQLEAPAGSVLIFNSQCWHAGGANTSESDRHAIVSMYSKDWLILRQDPQDGFPAEWFELLTDRQRELLRMHKGLGAPHTSKTHLM